MSDKERRVAREQERAEQPRPAAKVADAISARGAGKVGKGKAVRPRWEEIRIIIEAGPILPEFVSPFHASTPFKDKNKDAPKSASLFFKHSYALGLGDGAVGAGISAGAAIEAGIRVDLILGIALGNSTDRAGVCASTAADAGRADLISHSYYLHKLMTLL